MRFLPDDSSLKLAKQCKVTVDLLIDRIKPHLDFLFHLHGNPNIFIDRYQFLDRKPAGSGGIFLVDLPDGKLYLDEAGNFVRLFAKDKIDSSLEVFPPGYDSWIFAPHFGLLIMSLEDLVYEGEKRVSLLEERLEILTRIGERSI